MALGTAALKQSLADFRTSADTAGRSRVYGGLVGHLIQEIDDRLTVQTERQTPASKPEDFVHHVSVVCGYAGLITGFGMIATGFLYVLQR